MWGYQTNKRDHSDRYGGHGDEYQRDEYKNDAMSNDVYSQDARCIVVDLNDV